MKIKIFEEKQISHLIKPPTRLVCDSDLFVLQEIEAQ